MHTFSYFLVSLFLSPSPMVDPAPRLLGIASINNVHRACKSFIRKCRQRKKSSSSASQSDAETDSDPENLYRTPQVGDNYKENGSTQSLRYDGCKDPTIRKGNGSFKNNRNFDNCFPAFSRKASRSNTSTPSKSFKGATRKVSEFTSTPPLENPQNSRPPFQALSKSASKTPIMFSNSCGILKLPTIEKTLECTLEELCYGCNKKINVKRDVITYAGHIVQEEELLTADVKPGWKTGTKITFEGNLKNNLGGYPADITFVIIERRHQYFTREGDDLELAVKIPLIEALTGCTIPIPLLGGEHMSLQIEDVIYPGYEKIITGQGMPTSEEQEKRANLKITFLVEFPSYLADDQRSQIVEILQDSC